MFAELLAETGNSDLEVVQDAAGTSDLRGIDVSLAFDRRKLSVVEARSHVVHLRYQTRDIFEVVFELVDTAERLVVIASHWPSRRRGKRETEALRIAVAENIAFLVRDHLRLDSISYEQLRANDDLAPVQPKSETPILLLGDSTTNPSTAPSSTTSRPPANWTAWPVPPTTSTASKPKPPTTAATTPSSTTPAGASYLSRTAAFFISSTPAGEVFANRYQLLDQLTVSRGLLKQTGLRLDTASVDLYDADSVAPPAAAPAPSTDRR